MKAFFTACFILLACSLLLSAPLRNMETELRQPDGSVFSCLMSGDEYYHRPHDSNGYTIMLDNQTGWHVYADKQGPDLVPTSFIPGVDDPAARGLTPNLMPDISILRRNFESFRGSGGDLYGRAPHTGVVNNICVFIRFSDQTEFGLPVSGFDNIYNSTVSASMYGYFKEESDDQLDVTTTFYPNPAGGLIVSYQGSNPRSYYLPQSPANPGGYPQPGGSWDHSVGYQRLHNLLFAALVHIAPMVPPGLNVDMDGNGSVDNISFICKGQADATGILWPHAWVLDAIFPVPPAAYIHGAMPDEYNFEPQLADPIYGGGGADVAIVCHEFSHSLGFPDLYHYVGDGIDPCGWWDLMDHCFGTPQHHLAYMKMKYGQWFQPAEVQPLPPMGSATLTAFSGGDPFDCFNYQLPTGEEIWFEYRRNVGTYESTLPGTGLIMYRINPSMTGNAYVNDPLYPGLLDEVYVYRPYVTAGNPNGAINLAHYAWELMRTAINQFTDPAPSSASSPGFIAPLNIYAIGTNGSTSISFEIMTAGSPVPVIWTGKTDNNWFNAGNWTTGAVPTASDFTIIAQDPYMGVACTIPLSPGPGAVCGPLRVEYNLTMYPGASLGVNGHLNSIGWIVMDGNLLRITGKLIIEEGITTAPPPSLACQMIPTAQIMVGGNCRFGGGTNINLNAGQLIFANIGVSPPINNFTVDAFGVVLHDVIVNKTNSALSYNSIKIFALPTMIRGSLQVLPLSTLYLSSPQIISVDGNINVDPAGFLYGDLGTISLTGNPGPQTINIANPMSYLNNLEVSCSTGLTTNLVSNITIKGDFTINAGIFAANTFTMNIHGDWINNVGWGGFQKGTSRVRFCGTSPQQIFVGNAAGPASEDFYILELANSQRDPGILQINSPGLMVSCDIYDHSSGIIVVTEGMFTALSLADICISGGFQCAATGIINIYDQGNADMGADMWIYGGTVNIYSGNPMPGGVSTWGMYNASLTMSDGQMTFHNTGVNVVPMGGALSTYITGGIITVNGDFTIHRADFNPLDGIIVVQGSNPVAISAANGGNFHELNLQAAQVNTAADVLVNANLNIGPTTNLSVTANVRVVQSTMVDGVMDIWPAATYTSVGVMSITGTLNLHNGATLMSAAEIDVLGFMNCLGAPGSPAILSGTNRAHWKMFVMGTLAASWTDFSQLRDEGIWLVGNMDLNHVFDHCRFDDGGNSFITVENAQNLSIDDIWFESPGTYNITKNADAGDIIVTNAQGNLAGPVYEYDPWGRIYWVGWNQNLIVQSFTVSDDQPYVADQISYDVVIKNAGSDALSEGFSVYLFLNRSTPPGWDEIGDLGHDCPALGAEETYAFSFSGIYSMIPEDWTSWLLIDPEDVIWETDETDNLDSLGVRWLELPIADQVSISAVSASQGRIAWNYPIWATRFIIYECDDPYGAFDTYTGETSLLYYDVYLNDDKVFYQVIAERDDPFPAK